VSLIGAEGPSAGQAGGAGRLTLARYLSRKAGGALINLAMVVVLGFFSFRSARLGPGQTSLRAADSAPKRSRVGASSGRTRPLAMQFLRYVRIFHRGPRPLLRLQPAGVHPDLTGSGPHLLTGTAAVISMVLGLWLGRRSRGSDSWFDGTQTASPTLWSVPTFWLGPLLRWPSPGGLRLFPSADEDAG
jgi:peptide/nickel transport system permease protein